jgi:arsenite/tail-anchored protein-transporting ATPase
VRGPRTTTGSRPSKPRSRATIIPAVRSAPRYRFLGGKGGVGKTTCAAGIAVAAAAAGTRALVLSTDPAPSLGSALGRRLTATPRRIPLPGKGTLHAAEVDAARAINRWLAGRRAALERAALRGTWLDEEDVARLLRLSLPGIDEIAALLELSRLGQSRRYDLIVVDTAPTGHTLRMLGMPETLLAVARLFDRMQAKHRVMVEALRGGWQPDDDDLVISGMEEEARALAVLLRDRSRVAMTWVSLAEPMAVAETIDAARALAAQGIVFSDVILNRLTAEPPRACRWCAARRAFEAGAIRALRRDLRQAPIAVDLCGVVARDSEPVGMRALGSIGREIQGAGTLPPFDELTAPRARREVGKVPKVAGAFAEKVPATSGSLVLFGGKGGVGKTTCAAAAAAAAAVANPGRRILLISTDPAHSLADALGVALGDAPRRVARGLPNLEARELDAAAGFARLREKYRAAIDALFDRFARGMAVDAARDRQVMQDLIDLAPPGIDELAAVIDVVDALERHAADLVVLDTAPSGHALRLLEMPALAQQWTHALMAILLKYQPVVGLGDLAAILLELSQGLGRVRSLLADGSKTHFIVVTRAAALPRAESMRLLKELQRLHIHSPVVIVNATGAGECPRCRRQRAQEAAEVGRLRRDLRTALRHPCVVVTPAWMPPPHAVAALTAWHRSWQVPR